MVFKTGHSPFPRPKAHYALPHAAEVIEHAIRTTVTPKDLIDGKVYFVLSEDEGTGMEKVTLECVDKYFDILFASMPLLPGPAPARTLFRQAWKRVAPAYVANDNVRAFSEDEADKMFMLWGYAWRHFARGRENQLCSGSVDMKQRFRF